jgi:RES domain-containing protein
MIKVFRISKTKYIEDLSGTGAKRYGGRWNAPGTYALYTSQARSLALLELIVNLEGLESLRQDYSLAAFELDERQIVDLRDDFNPFIASKMGYASFRQAALFFFLEKPAPVLRVPSILIPKEYNFIFNPLHPDFENIRLLNVESIVFDSRFLTLMQ